MTTEHSAINKVQLAKQYLINRGYVVVPSMMTVDEVAYFLGLGRTTIYKLVNNGEFPSPYNLGSKSAFGKQHTKWKFSEVQEWLDSRKLAPKGEMK